MEGGRIETGQLDVTVTDATGNRTREISVPNDVATRFIVLGLVELLQLPPVGPDGQPLSYKFNHKQSGRLISDHQTLGDAGVAQNDTLRLVVEITAGPAVDLLALGMVTGAAEAAGVMTVRWMKERLDGRASAKHAESSEDLATTIDRPATDASSVEETVVDRNSSTARGSVPMSAATLDRQQAESVARLIEALNGTPEAVVRTDSLLMIKVTGPNGARIVGRTLTAREMIAIEREPSLLESPTDLLRLIGL